MQYIPRPYLFISTASLPPIQKPCSLHQSPLVGGQNGIQVLGLSTFVLREFGDSLRIFWYAGSDERQTSLSYQRKRTTLPTRSWRLLPTQQVCSEVFSLDKCSISDYKNCLASILLLEHTPTSCSFYIDKNFCRLGGVSGPTRCLLPLRVRLHFRGHFHLHFPSRDQGKITKPT